MVGVPAASPSANDLEPLARWYSLRSFLIAAQLLQEQRRPNAERPRKRDQSLETGSHVPGFQTAEHPGADPRAGGNIRQGQTLAFTHAPGDSAQLPADIARRRSGHGALGRGFG